MTSVLSDNSLEGRSGGFHGFPPLAYLKKWTSEIALSVKFSDRLKYSRRGCTSRRHTAGEDRHRERIPGRIGPLVDFIDHLLNPGIHRRKTKTMAGKESRATGCLDADALDFHAALQQGFMDKTVRTFQDTAC